MLRGLLIVLAIAAVLCGAPSPASAAVTGAAPAAPGLRTAGPEGESAPSDPNFGPVAIGIGIGGIVAMALFAWLVPLARRRRPIDQGSTKAGDDAPNRQTTADEQVTAALHRRTLRRARVRLEEDPIIASMRAGSPARREHGRARRSVRRSPPT